MSNSIFSDHIRFHENVLSVGGNDTRAIAAEYGTPTYVYSLAAVLENYKTIRDEYAKHHKNVSVHFSLKSNANFTLVKALVAAGAGIDCVSAGEVYKALACGCPPEHVVFAGVGKTQEELQFAVAKGVGCFNVENELELVYLNDLAGRASHKVHVALRLNPDVTANTHPNIATGHGGAKFGLSAEVVTRLLSESATRFPNLLLNGVHIHIGSQLGDTLQTKKAIEITLALVQQFPQVTAINIGGGMPVSYDNKPYPSIGEFAAEVCPLLQSYQVLLEPGRRIVAPTGILLMKVLYRKEQAGHRLLMVDASMTEIMRPALYSAKHAVVPLETSAEDEPESEQVSFTIVGPVCETTDVLAKDVRLPKRVAQPGQLLALCTVGAYGFAMANNYNARPLPPQVVVDVAGQLKCSTKRQTFEDLIRDECDKQ